MGFVIKELTSYRQVETNTYAESDGNSWLEAIKAAEEGDQYIEDVTKHEGGPVDSSEWLWDDMEIPFPVETEGVVINSNIELVYHFAERAFSTEGQVEGGAAMKKVLQYMFDNEIDMIEISQ